MPENNSKSSQGEGPQGWPIVERPNGVVLSIKAQPGAKKNEVRLEDTGQVKVCVTQRPEKGKANRAVLEVLAGFLGVKFSQVALVSGETSPKKQILIYGLSAKEVAEKLNGSLATRKDP